MAGKLSKVSAKTGSFLKLKNVEQVFGHKPVTVHDHIHRHKKG